MLESWFDAPTEKKPDAVDLYAEDWSTETAAPALDGFFDQPSRETGEWAEPQGFDDFFTAPAPTQFSDDLFGGDEAIAELPLEEPAEQSAGEQGFVEPEDVLVYEVTLEQLIAMKL